MYLNLPCTILGYPLVITYIDIFSFYFSPVGIALLGGLITFINRRGGCTKKSRKPNKSDYQDFGMSEADYPHHRDTPPMSSPVLPTTTTAAAMGAGAGMGAAAAAAASSPHMDNHAATAYYEGHPSNYYQQDQQYYYQDHQDMNAATAGGYYHDPYADPTAAAGAAGMTSPVMGYAGQHQYADPNAAYYYEHQQYQQQQPTAADPAGFYKPDLADIQHR